MSFELGMCVCALGVRLYQIAVVAISPICDTYVHTFGKVSQLI